MLNAFIAGTNFYGMPGVTSYYQNGYRLKSCIIMSAIVSSSIYHLVENSKHNMPGIGYFQDGRAQNFLLNIDRVAAVLSVIASLHHIYTQQIPMRVLFQPYFIGVLALSIPELVSGLYSSGRHMSLMPEWMAERLNPHKLKMDQRLEHVIYGFFHSVWHVAMFHASNIVSSY